MKTMLLAGAAVTVFVAVMVVSDVIEAERRWDLGPDYYQ